MSRLIYTNPKTFRCSGDCGDTIYALLYMKAVGATEMLLDESGGENYVRDGFICNGKTKFNQKSADFLYPFLKTQVDTEFYRGQDYDCWFNESDKDAGNDNITKAHAVKFNLKWMDLKPGWLTRNTIKEPEYRLIVNRTNRYHGNVGFYKQFLSTFDGPITFLGLEEEYDDFYKNVYPVGAFCKVKDCLGMANLIEASSHFIGNGSLVNSLAIGFGLEVYYEFCPNAANYLFQSPKFLPF